MQYSVPGRPPNTATTTLGQEPSTADVPIINLQDKSQSHVLKYSSLKDTYFYFQEGPKNLVFVDKKLPLQDSQPIPHPRFNLQYFTSLSSLAAAEGPTWAAFTPNHLGARIPLVHTDLLMGEWRKHLIGYEDVEICQYLEFGFPLGVDSGPDTKLVSARRNHGSAYTFYPWIDKFVREGVEKKYIAGPYNVQPFERIHISPMMTAPKRPDDRRPVFDATFGDHSLNNGTPTDQYMGEPISLVYPRIEDFRELVLKCGQGCFIWKRDLSSFFLQIPADPVDFPKLAFIWRGSCYFFLGLMFGLRNSGYQGQRVTTAIVWIHRRLGLESQRESMYNSINYSDDIGGCEATLARAEQSSQVLSHLFKQLGLKESTSKYHPPSTCMPFLGIQFDTVRMEMSIPPEKLEEVREEVALWRKKSTVTKKGLQQLLGKLFWVSKCVRFSRPFMGRLLQQLREVQLLPDYKKSPISEGCKEDMKWWERYLRRFNGVQIIYKDQPLELSLGQLQDTSALVNCGDAQMWGGGAYYGSEYWSRPFPEWLRDPKIPIHIKEFHVVIASCLLWGHHWSGHMVYIFCDNDAVVDSLTYERPKDMEMLRLVREFSYLVCSRNFTPVLRKISSKDNFEADFISRCHDADSTMEFYEKRNLTPKSLKNVPDSFFNIGTNW